MPNLYDLERLHELRMAAVEQQQPLLAEEATQWCAVAPRGGTVLRKQVAAALVGLALWLDLSTSEALAKDRPNANAAQA